MVTREEIDAYCTEQWRLMRAPGDWRVVADRFEQWGSNHNWNLYVPWRDTLYAWLSEHCAKNRARSRHAAAEAQSGAKVKGHVIHVCMLCWRPLNPPSNDVERDWIGNGLAVCDCVRVADRARIDGGILARVAQRGGRIVHKTYSHKPAWETVANDIQTLRGQMLARHGNELALRQAEWFDALCKASGDEEGVA